MREHKYPAALTDSEAEAETGPPRADGQAETAAAAKIVAVARPAAAPPHALAEAEAAHTAGAPAEPSCEELEAAGSRASQHYASWVEERSARVETQNARERERVAYSHERDALRAASQSLQTQVDELARIRRSFVYRTLQTVIRAEARLRETLRLDRPNPSRKAPKAERSRRSPGAAAAQPSPAQPPATADVKPLRVDPIAGRPRQPVHSERPLLLCLSHVAPWPPRAGNEYRIHRVLKWAKCAGYDLALVLCPLPGEEPTQDAEAALAGVYDNLLVVDRGGHIRHAVARDDLAGAVDALAGRTPERYAGQNERLSEKLNGVLTTFAPDCLLELLREIDRRNIVEVYWINYGFMSRALDVVESGALTLIDTHDVFSTKAAKVSRFGIRDDLSITAGEEGLLLDRAHIVVAIQSDEARELEAIVPGKRIVTVGVDMERSSAVVRPGAAPVLLMVASSNAMNRKGLDGFLRFAWPRIRQAVPGAQFHVVGAVGQMLAGSEPGVVKLGFVDDLEAAYDRARLVINPAVAGTGLKIKTLEALMQLKPVVLWPSGLDGVAPELRKYCRCVQNWYEFGASVIELLQDESAIRRIDGDRELISRLLSPDHVYRDLKRVFDERRG